MYRIFRSGDAGGTTAVGGSPPVAGVTNSGATGTLDVELWAIDDGVTTSADGEPAATPVGRSFVGSAESAGSGLSSRTVVVGEDGFVVDDPPLAFAVVVEPAAVLDAPEPPPDEHDAATRHDATSTALAIDRRLTASRTSDGRAARTRGESRPRASRVHRRSTRPVVRPIVARRAR